MVGGRASPAWAGRDVDGLVVGPWPGLMWLESWWLSSVVQFCHHKAPEEQGQDKFDPFASNFLVKGWSSLCSRRKKKILSSGCARAGSIKDASTAVTIIVHFWFSSLCFLPLAVLTAVERQGGNSLSQQLCLHNPMDGAGQRSQGTVQPATPVTWERPRFPGHSTACHFSDTGQAGMWSTRTEGQAEQNQVVPQLLPWEGW